MKDQTLTLAVSGQLWNRSLVMIDPETKSLWSHILGECMSGELKGAQLQPLVGDMLTWKTWRAEHPQTTVLNLPRTSKDYGREAYDKPERFVFGFLVNGQPRHCSFAGLLKTPVVNVSDPQEPVVVTFDSASGLVRIFSRRVDDRDLTFTPADNVRMRDNATDSLWDRSTGTAIEGTLKGKQLEAQVGIVSFASVWKVFHAESQDVTAAKP